MTIDGETLNVDRWSAMETAIRALLNDQYPYAAIDHLNGRTSNLPTLILIGIPFYYLGNVGYLQSFTFLLFMILIHDTFHNFKTRVFGLLLLVLSTSYGWEIYTKSDLMSNFIIILIFLVLVQKRYDENKKNNVILIAAISSSLLLTRLVAIIPLSLLLFKKIFKLSVKKKIIFLSTSILTVSILLTIVFNNYNSLENFILYNPFELQNRQLPFIISIICIILPMIFSFYIHNLKYLIKYSVILLFIPITTSFVLSIFEKGLYNSIVNSGFDISYFNIVTPFLIFYLTIKFNDSQRPEESEDWS